MGHKRLDTGQVSIPGSGDTIHDGGNKLHDNFNELYRAFGDQRLERRVMRGDEEWISIHATGYFQHKPLSEYAVAVKSGSMHDIDSTLSAGHFPVRLPTIGKLPGQARRGERVILQDTKGSWSSVPVRVEPASGNNITGSNSSGYLVLNEDKRICTLTVVNDDIGFERWDYKVESIGGIENAIVSTSVQIPASGTPARVDLYNTANYNAIKVMVYAESILIATSAVEKRTAYELHLMHTDTDVISTHHNVINWNTTGSGGSVDMTDVIAIPSPVKYTNNSNNQMVAIDFTSDEPVTHKVIVSVKSVGSISQKLTV